CANIALLRVRDAAGPTRHNEQKVCAAAASRGSPRGSDMNDRVERAGLSVAAKLAGFIEREALTGTGVGAEQFWRGLADILARFTPENRALLSERDRMQAEIDRWHSARPGRFDAAEYQAFLRELGYLVAEPPGFNVQSTNVDAEVATMAGPQLVVPSLNDRFVLNAANARWGACTMRFTEPTPCPARRGRAAT